MKGEDSGNQLNVICNLRPGYNPPTDQATDEQLYSWCKTHVKSATAGSVSLSFTFFKGSSIPPVEYRTLDVFTIAAAPTTLSLLLVASLSDARILVIFVVQAEA